MFPDLLQGYGLRPACWLMSGLSVVLLHLLLRLIADEEFPFLPQIARRGDFFLDRSHGGRLIKLFEPEVQENGGSGCLPLAKLVQ